MGNRKERYKKSRLKFCSSNNYSTLNDIHIYQMTIKKREWQIFTNIYVNIYLTKGIKIYHDPKINIIYSKFISK